MVQNVLLLTIDSLRFDHFPLPAGEYSIPDSTVRNHGVEKHKRLIRSTEAPIAQDSVSFSSAYATGPGTDASFPAMLTGTLPLSYAGLGSLSAERPRVATNLRNAGLTTGGFQSNPFLSRHFNYDIGFDEFKDYQNPLMGVATKIFPRGIEINNPKLSWANEKFQLTKIIKKIYQYIRGKPRPYVSAEVITDDTIVWLSQVEAPFFAWAHYMDVHHPCYPPPKYRKAFGAGNVSQTEVAKWYAKAADEGLELTEYQIDILHRLYNASIAYTIDQIGRILDHIYQSGQYEETLIILTSDHGELFGEYGHYSKTVRMYDELLHVPLVIVNGPDSLNKVATNLTSLLDIPPLIHKCLNINIPDNYQGKEIDVGAPREYIIAEHQINENVIVGARSENWLYEEDGIEGEHRLFNVSDGQFIRVRSDTAKAEPQLIRQVVMDRLETLDVGEHHLRDGVGDDIEDRLEDLGYI